MVLRWCNGSPDFFFLHEILKSIKKKFFIAFLCRQSLSIFPLASFQYVLFPFGNQVHQTWIMSTREAWVGVMSALYTAQVGFRNDAET